jgi:hypothetical protein
MGKSKGVKIENSKRESRSLLPGGVKKRFGSWGLFERFREDAG